MNGSPVWIIGPQKSKGRGKRMQNNEYVVEMRGIDKIYPNGIAANQGVDFLVKKGEIHALMGENGAGKSTLMKMLFGMEQPAEYFASPRNKA